MPLCTCSINATIKRRVGSALVRGELCALKSARFNDQSCLIIHAHPRTNHLSDRTTSTQTGMHRFYAMNVGDADRVLVNLEVPADAENSFTVLFHFKELNMDDFPCGINSRNLLPKTSCSRSLMTMDRTDARAFGMMRRKIGLYRKSKTGICEGIGSLISFDCRIIYPFKYASTVNFNPAE